MAGAAIIYSDGFGHPFAETSAALADVLRGHGWMPSIENDFDTALAGLDGAGLLIVNALRWSMTQHEKYAPHRDQWGFVPTAAQMERIDGFVKAGGGLLVYHTATICWDEHPVWRAVMGGGWTWGVSHHPPFGDVEVELTSEGRALSAGPARFSLLDEVYHHLDPAPDCRLLATAGSAEGPQPVAWLRRHGAGRVAVDALGHDRRSLDAPGHKALLDAMIAWLDGSD